MLDFFAKAKEIELSTGRRAVVLRPGLGHYFRFTEAILNLKGVNVIQDAKDIEKYLKWLSENTEEVARHNVYWRDVLSCLEHFVKDEVDSYTEAEKIELIKESQEFNSISRGGQGQPIQSVKQLNKALNDIVSFIVANAHYNIEYIGKELDIVQASILADHFNSFRVTQINDMIAAIGGAVGGEKAQKSVSKYISTLRGQKSGTFEEAIREMIEADDMKKNIKGGGDG